jgi:RNA polymerase sigma-70 factor (ECF subfamily)
MMQPEPDDLHAIRRLKRGDIGGLEILIARHQGKALRVAFLVTHDNAMAEDVVQEAFVRFFHRAHYFDECHPFEPYFLRSVVNAALNAVQRESKVQHFDLEEADVSGMETLLERATSVEEQAEFNALKQEIFEALTALPPRQRAVIVQRYYLEMTEKEMAEAMQAPPGTVKWLLNAARARLRSLLGRERMAE